MGVHGLRVNLTSVSLSKSSKCNAFAKPMFPFLPSINEDTCVTVKAWLSSYAARGILTASFPYSHFSRLHRIRLDDGVDRSQLLK